MINIASPDMVIDNVIPFAKLLFILGLYIGIRENGNYHDGLYRDYSCFIFVLSTSARSDRCDQPPLPPPPPRPCLCCNRHYRTGLVCFKACVRTNLYNVVSIALSLLCCATSAVIQMARFIAHRCGRRRFSLQQDTIHGRVSE